MNELILITGLNQCNKKIDLFFAGILLAVVKRVQLFVGLGKGPGITYSAVKWVIAVGEVLQHLLAGKTPRKLAVSAMNVRSTTVSDVEHQKLRTLHYENRKK